MTKKLNNPYSYPLTKRIDMVNYICNIGDYYYQGMGSYAINFTVPAYSADLGWDNVWEKRESFLRDCFPSKVIDRLNTDSAFADEFEEYCKSAYEEYGSSLWSWGQEAACSNVEDDDYYRMLWDGTMAEVDFVLLGRGGKHLCVSEFDKHNLNVTSDTLHDDMMTQESSLGWVLDGCDSRVDSDTLKKNHYWSVWSYEEIRKLYKFVCQWEVNFTEKKASQLVEDGGMFHFWINVIRETVEEEIDAAVHARELEESSYVIGVP